MSLDAADVGLMTPLTKPGHQPSPLAHIDAI